MIKLITCITVVFIISGVSAQFEICPEAKKNPSLAELIQQGKIRMYPGFKENIFPYLGKNLDTNITYYKKIVNPKSFILCEKKVVGEILYLIDQRFFCLNYYDLL